MDDFDQHPRVRALKRDGRHIFRFLCSATGSHYSGIFYMPVVDISEACDIPQETVLEVLQVLEAGPVEFSVDNSGGREVTPLGYGFLIEYDYDRSIVWVRNMLSRQMVLEKLTDKQKLGISNHLIKFMNSKLVARFMAYYEGIGIPFPKGFDGPPSRTGQLVGMRGPLWQETLILKTEKT